MVLEEKKKKAGRPLIPIAVAPGPAGPSYTVHRSGVEVIFHSHGYLVCTIIRLF